MRIYTRFRHTIRHPDLPYLLVILAVFLTVVFTNFPLNGAWFTGWDNLHPEFNFRLNIDRALEGVWQTNQGLGLVGGHGFAATLPHTLLVWALSHFFPAHALRASFTFLMLLTGSIGIYALTRSLLSSLRAHIHHPNGPDDTVRLAALFSSIFTMLNLATAQNFYIQLEAFIVHFAFLPWLLVTLMRFYQHPRIGTYLGFLVASILIIPAGFIPPLFVVQMLLVGITMLAMSVRKHIKASLVRGLVVLGTIVTVNAFWLLPFTYYTLTHSGNYLNAYNNLRSTEDFITSNAKYGDISDVALMKSFLFESNDIKKDGSMVRILAPWISHFAHPVTMAIGYAIFALSILGSVSLIRSRSRNRAGLALVSGYTVIFLLLATGTPPFSWVTEWLRSTSALFEQAFRVAFTKFSVAFGLHMAVLAGAGVYAAISRIRRPLLAFLTAVLMTASLLWYGWPAIAGDFLYRTTKIAIPQAYLDLFAYVDTQPADGRIMNLPQGWNWGWTLYTWGYSGSGFLWYGIRQPIMDRAFDVWSPANENYYWELSHALYAKDWEQLASILEKYHIRWILYDQSVIPVPGGKWKFTVEELKTHLDNDRRFSKAETFGHLTLYRVNLANTPDDDVLVYEALPNILPTYRWNNRDMGSSLVGPYQSVPMEPADLYFPYRSLFTNRKADDRDVGIANTPEGYRISPILPTFPVPITQGIYEADDYLPLTLTVTAIDEKTLTLSYSYQYPFRSPGFQSPTDGSIAIPLDGSDERIRLSIGSQQLELPQDDSLKNFAATIPFWRSMTPRLSAVRQNGALIGRFDLEAPRTPETVAMDSEMFVPFLSGTLSYDSNSDPSFLSHKRSDCATVSDEPQPIIWDEEKQVLKFVSSDKDECFDIILPDIRHDMGYLIEIQSKWLSGKPIQFALINAQVEKTEFEIPLPAKDGYQSSYFIIPPMQYDGLGYGLHFSIKPTGAELSESLLKRVRLTPLPYTSLVTLRYGDTRSRQPVNRSYQATMRSGYRYDVTVNRAGSSTIVLSQAYDTGWHAYTSLASFPYFTPIGQHVSINNWANGWILPKDTEAGTTIYLFYIPQILAWIGMALFPIFIITLVLFGRSPAHHPRRN